MILCYLSLPSGNKTEDSFGLCLPERLPALKVQLATGLQNAGMSGSCDCSSARPGAGAALAPAARGVGTATLRAREVGTDALRSRLWVASQQLFFSKSHFFSYSCR